MTMVNNGTEALSTVARAESMYFSDQIIRSHGTTALITLQNAVFDPIPDGATAIAVAPTAVVSKRLELSLGSMALGTGSTGIDVAPGASIPSESYVVRDYDITGPGTPIAGKLANDDAALFENNRGFENTAILGSLSMEGNVTATTITVAGVFVKLAGTTVAGDLGKFSHTNNRLTHDGGITRAFLAVDCLGILFMNFFSSSLT